MSIENVKEAQRRLDTTREQLARYLCGELLSVMRLAGVPEPTERQKGCGAEAIVEVLIKEGWV